MTRTYLALILCITLTAGCGPILPKFLPADIQPPTAPAATSTPRAPLVPVATPTPPAATPTPTPARTATATSGPSAPSGPDDAIRLAQQNFAALKGIQKKPAGSLGASTDIVVQERSGGWNLIFWQGSGDCAAVCINNHYWYVTVEKTGAVSMAGEYERAYDSASNAVKATGVPMWGVPRP